MMNEMLNVKYWLRIKNTDGSLYCMPKCEFCQGKRCAECEDKNCSCECRLSAWQSYGSWGAGIITGVVYVSLGLAIASTGGLAAVAIGGAYLGAGVSAT
jgi:hypothetical protein